jgi:HAD superfamily hydrolase (TIGR01549 family)
VLMDIDNTVYAYDVAHAAASDATMRKTVKLTGVTRAEYEPALDAARREVKETLQETASAHSRLLYFARMLEKLGMKSQPLMALDLEQTYWRNFLSASTLFPQVKEFLEDLRVAGIPIAAVTDLTAQIQFRKLIYFGLDHYFDHIVTSEEAGVEKPASKPFQMAMERLLVKPSERVWFVGDSAKKDIAGAKAALGAVTLQKRHEGVEISAEADAVFDHFQELRDLLFIRR